ncbi:MAG: S-layer homology domain-containing protein [Clostridia bacterium]|nr:S-layer homology domain-containing protein [Clostridia bacterium]
MKKRILSIILAALMVIGTFAIGTAAADEFKIVAETSDNGDGTYDVAVMMYNSPKISSLDLVIKFDNSKVKLVDYEGYDPENWVYDPTCCLSGTTSNLGAGNALDTLSEVTLILGRAGVDPTVNGKLLGLTFKLEDGVKNADIEVVIKTPCIQQPTQSAPQLEFTPVTEDGFVGVLTLDELTLEDKTVTYDGNTHSLEIKGVDNTMNVQWTNNGKKDAGTYTVTAVVSKAGYESKTLTATLTINKANAVITGVELWPVAEGEIPEIKSLTNAKVQIPGGESWTLTASNAAIVKDGDVYKLSGVTNSTANIVLDTTVTPTFVAAEDLVDSIVEEAGIENTEANPAPVSPVATKITPPEVELPYGYTLELVPVDGVIDAEGTITRPEDDSITVPVEFKVIAADGTDTGATVTVYYEITKKTSSGSDELALLLLYYHRKLEETKKQVETVKSDVSGATVAAGTKVTLSTATAGATIHYTTDGSTATVLSPVYTGPIVVDKTVTISAIATKSGMKTSAPATFFYTVSETSIALKADAANIKYMEGRGDKFEPEAYATRYEVIKALANVFDIKTTNAPLALTDVADEYKELVDLCTAAGIIKGYEDKTFRGNEAITRAEVATMICNIMGLDVEGAKDAGFSDVSGWATKYVNACANAKYVNGNGDGTFAPGNNIKRNELTVIINNITGAKAGTSCSYADVVEGTWYFGYVAAAAK